MDQVCSEVPLGHVLASLAADAGIPRRGVGEGWYLRCFKVLYAIQKCFTKVYKSLNIQSNLHT